MNIHVFHSLFGPRGVKSRAALTAAGAVVVMLALAACGGVAQPEVVATAPAPRNAAVPSRGLVRVERVENRTGRAECDDLAHYVHLKTAQVLEAGGWNVATDDLLAQADFLGLRAGGVEGGATDADHVRVEILRAEEKAGATLSLAVFSTQQQTAAVTVRLVWRDARTGAERTLEGSGASSKGAWGVLAKVNRDALLRREGFWQFDHSLLGGAAEDALARALTPFP